MSSLKRRLSGTRTFAATLNPGDAGTAISSTSFGGVRSEAAASAAAAAAAAASAPVLAGPMAHPTQPLDAAGGAPPVVVRFAPVEDIEKPLRKLMIPSSSSSTRDEATTTTNMADGSSSSNNNTSSSPSPQLQAAVAVPVPETTTQIAKLHARLKSLEPVIKPTDTLTKRVTIPMLRMIAAFVGATFRDLAPFAGMSRATRAACTHCVDSISVVPEETSVAALSRHGSLDSLARFLKRGDRGRHARSFTLVSPSHVYRLEAQVLGPSLTPADILRTVGTMPNLTTVDLRSVALRGYVPWSDHLLSDVARMCPQLQVLRVGVSFAKAWPKGWWQPVAHSLKEFVVGSRREDAEFIDNNSNNNNMTMSVAVPVPPLQLPLEDVFAMVRGAPNFEVLKIWPALSFPQLTQFISPSSASVAPLTNLQHLSLTIGTSNAALLFTPEGDAVLAKEREAAGIVEIGGASDPRGGGAGGGGGARGGGGRAGAGGGGMASPAPARGNKGGAAAASDDASRFGAALYPSLVSITVADVNSKPDLITELMQRMLFVAPDVRHWNVTNTHKQGPTAAAIAHAASQQRTRRPHASSSSS